MQGLNITQRLGKIKSIEELKDFTLSEGQKSCFNPEYDGYRIVTNKFIFLVLIDNDQVCCEHWGYVTSEDELDRFIGKELMGLRLTDTALASVELAMQKKGFVSSSGCDVFFEGGVQFVDFITRAGTFQLAVYNAHNGYYGHSIMVLQNDTVLMNGVV